MSVDELNALTVELRLKRAAVAERMAEPGLPTRQRHVARNEWAQLSAQIRDVERELARLAHA